MMALLLPQWAPPESLHRLANVRRQRSRKSARATHGATQSSTSTKASTDHFKIPSTEPCCNLISPLVMTPRKPVRRSSRLRVRRGSREDVKTDTQTDMDAAEWYSRVLANNGVVEVDPVTMAEHMQHAKYYQADSNNNNNTYSHYGSSSEVPDVYPSRSSGFPARVPLGVALAAGSAVALAIIALLIQALHKESDGTNSSDSEGSSLTSSFKGKPVAPDASSKVSHQANDSKVLASAAATGASFSNFLERNKSPSPPSLSKGEKSRSESKYASVPPFFDSDRTTKSSSRPVPPPVSRWQEDKYKSVRPFFSDEAEASTDTVGPSFSDEQGTQGKNENGPSANKTVAPFFPDDQLGSENAGGSASLQNNPPSFPDEQQSRNGPSLESVATGASFSNFLERNKTPSPPSLSKGEKSRSESKYASVPPFFDSDRTTKSSSRPAPPPVSRWQEDKYKSVRPFFLDEAEASTDTVGPSFSDEQGTRGKNENGPSANKTVAPFFPDDQLGSENAGGSASLQNNPPSFPDEQQSRNGPSLESVATGASFSNFLERNKTPSPPSLSKGEKSRSESKYASVPPFFDSDRSTKSSSRPAPPPVSRWQEDKYKSVRPFFPDEQQGRNSTGVSQSEGTVKVENVKPFFPDEQVGTASATVEVENVKPFFPDEKMTEIAGKPQGQHKEFMKGTTEERLAPNTSGAFSFQGDKEAARALSSDELALLEDIKAEEERRFAKMQALQSAFPALAIGAGAVGALVGVDGAFEMVGVTATASFISYELLWATKRQELVDEISSITDHHKLFNFLQKRKIVKDDC